MCLSNCFGPRCFVLALQTMMILVLLFYLFGTSKHHLIRIILFKTGTILDLLKEFSTPIANGLISSIYNETKDLVIDLDRNDTESIEKNMNITIEYTNLIDQEKSRQTTCWILIFLHFYGIFVTMLSSWIGLAIYQLANGLYLAFVIAKLSKTGNLLYVIDIIIYSSLLWHCFCLILNDCTLNVFRTLRSSILESQSSLTRSKSRIEYRPSEWIGHYHSHPKSLILHNEKCC
ncbi:hypothetical protein SSS_04786 [Sarcoptes scabiei]|uniref:Uncharacterized protein n=1 Tax=Sarcoptes scabiei TaxID=52283 RepID=A0A834VHG2_SARSC|nr:hypothetical protein SSS_04786 [Sarcoptes scabiei]